MTSKGLARAKEIYENRSQRACELRRQGKKVIGYFCCYAPVEFITALDMAPYRITGNVSEPITRADDCLDTIMCSFSRSCFDLAMKGNYDFLDGVVFPHSCDTVQALYDIWKYYRKPDYSYFLNVPHTLSPASYEFFKKELVSFQQSLEKYAGRPISQSGLMKAIGLHNENRRLLRQLYDLRKGSPPLLSGSEVMPVLVAGAGIPVEEYNQLLRETIEEVAARKPTAVRPVRALISGSEVDDTGFIRLLEECGADVVMDDLCTGTRCFWEDVELTGDPLDGIVDRYLSKIRCPRTYRESSGDYARDMEDRFGYLKQYCRDFNVNAVILYIFRYCDTYEFDAPGLRDYLLREGLSVLHLEEEYNTTAMERLRTRIQAFFEVINGGQP